MNDFFKVKSTNKKSTINKSLLKFVSLKGIFTKRKSCINGPFEEFFLRRWWIKNIFLFINLF